MRSWCSIYIYLSLYINVNVFVLSIYLSVCLVSISNIFREEEVYDYIEYPTHQKKFNDRTYKQISKLEDPYVDGTSILSTTGILISRDSNDVYIYLYIKA